MAKKKGGIDNLLPVQSKEEARARGANGGVASGEARRRKKTMREALQMIMSLDVQDQKAKARAKAMLGIEDEEINNQLLVLASMVNQSLKGNVQAANFVRDTMGEKPIDKVENTGYTKIVFSGEDDLE